VNLQELRLRLRANGRDLFVGPWDARVALRSAAIGTLTLLVALLVTAVTDEGGISWIERSGRIMPVAPVCSAIAAWAVLAQAASRGETLALAALGRSDIRTAVPVALGAAAVSIATSIFIAMGPGVHLDGFFPAAIHANAWFLRGETFVDLPRGVAVAVDGRPIFLPDNIPPPSFENPTGARAAASVVTFVSGLALSLLAARLVLVGAHSTPLSNGLPRSRTQIYLVCAFAVALTAFLFQSSASGRTPALLAVMPPLVLLMYSLWVFRDSDS